MKGEQIESKRYMNPRNLFQDFLSDMFQVQTPFNVGKNNTEMNFWNKWKRKNDRTKST